MIFSGRVGRQPGFTAVFDLGGECKRQPKEEK
jgi:hypothetical protein